MWSDQAMMGAIQPPCYTPGSNAAAPLSSRGACSDRRFSSASLKQNDITGNPSVVPCVFIFDCTAILVTTVEINIGGKEPINLHLKDYFILQQFSYM